MIAQADLPGDRYAVSKQIHALIANGSVMFAGNRRLKIYGTLACSSGKRMKATNRVFFTSGQEALDLGYRPCGHCMRMAYRQWQATFKNTGATRPIISRR